MEFQKFNRDCIDDISGGSLEKKIVGSSVLFPFKVHQDVSKAVCKIEVHQGIGTAFLAKFPVTNNGSALIISGVFTNNHVLSKEDLADGKTFRIQFDAVPVGDSTNPSPLALTVPITGKFRFTCSVLDVTFVRFEDDVIQNLLSNGCQFLEVTSEGESVNEPVFIFQHPGGKDMRIAHGCFLQYYGTDLFHSVSTDFGSSGSPVALSSGKVIGIHRARSTRKDNYNIAVAMKPVIKAILHLLSRSFCRKLFCNPDILNKGYAADLLKIGLQRCDLGPHSIFQGPMFVSPAKYLISFPISVLQRKAPVWFVPTSHGWYWTPTDPSDKKKETNWMSVSQLQIVGGDLDGQILSETDVTIINWLCQHNIVCCDDFSHPRRHSCRLYHPYRLCCPHHLPRLHRPCRLPASVILNKTKN